MTDQDTTRDIEASVNRITALSGHAYQLQAWESGHYQLDQADNRHASPKLEAGPFLSWLTAFETGLTKGYELGRQAMSAECAELGITLAP